MTPVYEVQTTHTEQMLKDFIAFRENIRNGHINFRLFMLGVCSVTVAFMARDMKGFLYTFSALAVLFFTLLLIRKPLAFSKLAKADEIYQNKAELSFVFGEKEFRVTNSLLGDEKRFKYGEIPFLYSDSTYYYISANNEDLHMLPFADFTLGDPESFREFIEHKTGKIIQPVKLSWKLKLGIMKQAWDMRMQEVADDTDNSASRKGR